MPESISTLSKEKLTAELIPPEGHDDVGHTVFSILDEILQDKNALGLPSKWAYHHRLEKNKHWKSKTKKAALQTANLMFTHLQRTVNMLTDNNPTFNIKRGGAHQEIHELLLHTAENWWHEEEQQNVLEKSVRNGEMYGCCIEKVVFTKELEGGLGEVETFVIDPYHFGFYPVKTLDLQKAGAVFHFWPMSLREARHEWPKSAAKIHSDKDLIAELGESRREIQSGSGRIREWFTTISNVVKHMVGNYTDQSGAESEEVLIVECWVKDYTRLPNEDPDSQDPPDYKYTGKIRQITTCTGGDVVLHDKDNPSINLEILTEREVSQNTYLFDKYPFSMTQSITDTNNAWGESDFEQLEGLQIALNKVLSELNLFKSRASRLIIKNPRNSGVRNSQLTNYPGVVNPANHLVSEAIKYMEPPKAPVDYYKTFEITKQLFFLVAGDFELELAQTPGRDVIAYKAIAALLERATTMNKGKIRNYSKMIRIRGRMYLSHVQNWYTEPRQIAYEQDGQEVTEEIKGPDLIVPIKLTVVSGSTMPVSRVQQREEARELYRAGAIDQEELLKSMDWADWKKVLKRMQQGPFGAILEMLAQIGTPPELLQFMQELFQADPKDFQKAIEQEKVPSFQQLVQPEDMQQQITMGEQAEAMETEANVNKTDAETDKLEADILLIREKTITERVLQIVKTSGIMFDEEKLKIERAKVVKEMDEAREQLALEEKRIDADLSKAKMSGDTAIETAKMKGTQTYSKKRGQGPYRERGMKSNNQNSRTT